jgi:hypothetical protein
MHAKKLGQFLTFSGRDCSYSHMIHTKKLMDVFKWEFKQFFNNIPNDTILLCIDFLENYTFKTPNNVHDMHWYNF